MTLSLRNLVGSSSTLRRRALIGNFLMGASSEFWHGADSIERGLRWQLAHKVLEKRAAGARFHDANLRACASGVPAARRCDCEHNIRPPSRRICAIDSWSYGWSGGSVAKRHLRFAVRASSSGGSLGRKSGSKTKLHFVCENCGETFSQWWGACQNCKEMNTLKEFREPVVTTAGPRGGAAARAVERITSSQDRGKLSVDRVERSTGKGAWLKGDSLHPQRLSDVAKGFSRQHWRLALPGETGSEVCRVLGGGIVPGSLILVGGDPGVGKSTLLLQIAGLLALGHDDDPAPVLYISGEEDLALRVASRFWIRVEISAFNEIEHREIGAHELFLYSATDLELVLEAIQELKPRAVIVDSIQTVYLPEATGSAGSVIQVRECAAALLRLSKQTSIPILLVGHVTKTGDIAGPRVLEHIVDVVLYMEGERLQSHRLLRVVKNRYGSSDEVGVFEMVEGGLQAITNPSALFLSERASDSSFTPSAAVAVTMEGSRPILLEVQALCSFGSNQQAGRRTANGVDNQRLYLLLAVLMKQAGLKLQNQDVFINVVGGLQLREPASDIAVAIAICSSYLDKPVPRDMAFIGEIGLGGEIRSVGQLERRISEAAKLGFKHCIVPRLAKGVVKNITAVPCAHIRDVIERALGWPE